MPLKKIVLHFGILSFACCCLAAPATAQHFFPSDYPAQARLCSRGSRDARIQWYYIDVFLPIFLEQDSILLARRDLLFFLNPKVVSTELSRDEENLGIGVRYLSTGSFDDDGFILGFNLFYDTKYSINGIRYHQLGSGLEFISRWLDLRANYYHPLSGKKTVYTTHSFAERSLLRHVREEEPLRGYDLEIGTLVPGLSSLCETRLYAGGYWYTATLGRDISGKKVRLELTPFPLLSLTLELRDDTVFGSDILAGFRISIPFDIGRAAKRKNPLANNKTYLASRRGGASLRQRMSDPVIRDLDIVSVVKNTTDTLRPMLFVDNSHPGDPAADGSLSRPYDTLAAAFGDSSYGEGVWIYVRQGDGTANGYTGSFTLADGSGLWGEGYRYLDLGGAGYPVLDGGGADAVITLGRDNTVMGVQMQNADKGISGENFGDALIRNNIITQNGVPTGAGIALTSSAAGGAVSALITQNLIAGNTGNGIQINVDNFSSFSLLCSDNTIRDNTSGSGIVLITGSVPADTGILDAIIMGNTVTGNGSSGIYAQSNGDSRLSAQISRNTITGNSQYGIYLDDLGTSVLTLDAGNGALESPGYNAIFGNDSYHINNNTDLTVKAENNWWGRATPEAFKFRRSVDYDPWLTQAPD